MKRKLLAVALLLGCSVALTASIQVRADGEIAGPALMSSITLGPPGTTTGILLVNHYGANIDTAMVEREAAMVVEENKVFQPSYLGRYAQEKGYADIREAARDIVDNGVEE